MRSRHLLMALALGLSAGAASAQNLRCGNTFAERGDSKSSVLAKCGEPAYRDSTCKVYPDPPPLDGKVRRCVDIDTWTYRPGRGQFLTMLEFREGTLDAIKYGDRIP